MTRKHKGSIRNTRINWQIPLGDTLSLEAPISKKAKKTLLLEERIVELESHVQMLNTSLSQIAGILNDILTKLD